MGRQNIVHGDGPHNIHLQRWWTSYKAPFGVETLFKTDPYIAVSTVQCFDPLTGRGGDLSNLHHFHLKVEQRGSDDLPWQSRDSGPVLRRRKDENEL